MSKWQTEQLVGMFLRDVRGAIPGAQLQLEVLLHVVRNWWPSPSRILDLGCGDGILGRTLLSAFPTANVVFADFSDPMLDAARIILGHNPQATVVKADFGSPAWIQAVGGESSFDIVISGLAIHHQPDERKKQLYAEIHEILVPGGVFLNLEHVASRSQTGKKLFDEFFIDSLWKYHSAIDKTKTRESVASIYYHRPDKKENILAPVDDQCQWLRQIGFTDVDCFLKVFELAIFGGRKARSAK
jgi:SAM-dependent methyltransferase